MSETQTSTVPESSGATLSSRGVGTALERLRQSWFVPGGIELLQLSVLTLVGVALVVINYKLFPSAYVFLGGTAVMLAVRKFGPFWGATVAFIVFFHTLSLWGHPYGLLLFVLEAFFVGMLGALRISRHIVVSDILFWVLASPIVILLNWQVVDLPPSSALFVYITQSLNGIFCAVVANLLMLAALALSSSHGYSRAFGLANPAPPRLRLRSLVITVAVATILFPTLLVHTTTNTVNLDEAVTKLNAEVSATAEEVRRRLHNKLLHNGQPARSRRPQLKLI